MTAIEPPPSLAVVGALSRRPGREVLLARDHQRAGALVVVKPARPGDLPPPLLHHRNLASILEIRGDSLVIEYIDGPDLSSAFGLLPPTEPARSQSAASLLLGVAEGLAALHAVGQAHGDLRPENVLLAGGIVPKLTDYAQAGARGGTLAYLAPERIVGLVPPEVAADMYALGILLYEAVFGQHPFHAALREPADLARRHLETVIRPPTASGHESPLWRLIERLTVRDPRRRLCAAAAAAQELEDVAHGVAIAPLWPELSPTLGALVATCLERLADGGPVTAIVGGPGSGKTRLIDALACRIRWRAQVDRLRWPSSPPTTSQSRGDSRARRVVLVDGVVGPAAWISRRRRAGTATVLAMNGTDAPDAATVLRLPTPPPEVAIGRRLAALEPKTRDALVATALAGGTLHPIEAEALGYDPETLERAAASGLAMLSGPLTLGNSSVRTEILASVAIDTAQDVARLLLPRLDLNRPEDLSRAADLAARAGDASAPDLLERAALALEGLGRPAEALEKLDAFLDLVPESWSGQQTRLQVLRSLGRTREALDAADALVELARLPQNHFRAAEALRLRAQVCLYATGNQEGAVRAERDIARALDSPALSGRERGRVLMTAANVARGLGDLPLAVRRGLAALDCFGTDDQVLRFTTLQNLAEFARAEARLSEAARLLEIAVPGLADFGGTARAGFAQTSLAHVYVGMGRLWEAREQFARAQARFIEAADQPMELVAHANQVYTECHLGLPAGGLDRLELLALELEPDAPFQAAHALVNLAAAFREGGDLPRSESLARRARATALAAALPDLEAEALAELSRVAGSVGAGSARVYAAGALSLARTSSDPTTLAAAAVAAARAGLPHVREALNVARERASAEWLPLLDLERGRLLAAEDPAAAREALRSGARAALRLADGAGPARDTFLARRDIRALACALLGLVESEADVTLASALLPSPGAPPWVVPVVESARLVAAGRRPGAAELRDALQLACASSDRADVTLLVTRLARSAAGYGS